MNTTPRPGDTVPTIHGSAIWVGSYNGVSIYRTGPNSLWTPETGFYDTVEEARDSIDAWRARLDADADAGERVAW